MAEGFSRQARKISARINVFMLRGAVGVLREVLVAGGVQDVDAEALVLELHHGGGDGDAPLLLDLHPVGGRKLFKVCRLRDIPIFTFINKMDREARAAGPFFFPSPPPAWAMAPP